MIKSLHYFSSFIALNVLFISLFCSNKLCAQVIFKDDFGNATSRVKSTNLPSNSYLVFADISTPGQTIGSMDGFNNYVAANKTWNGAYTINNYYYAVVAPRHIYDFNAPYTQDDVDKGFYKIWPNDMSDHTNGSTDPSNSDGAVLVVNAGDMNNVKGLSGAFYGKNNLVLKYGYTYKISYYTYNVSSVTYSAQQRLLLLKKDGSNLIVPVETHPSQGSWQENSVIFKAYSATCTTKLGTNILVNLELDNIGTSNGGDDFLVDDIAFEQVSDDLNYSTSNTFITCPDVISSIPIANPFTGATSFSNTSLSGYVGANGAQTELKNMITAKSADGQAVTTFGANQIITFSGISSTTRLFYDGNEITDGQQITAFDPSKLDVYKADGVSTADFSFSYTDANGLNSDPAAVSISATSSLPVQYLKQLTATVQGSTVSLDWATAQELNNKGFNVEESVDAGKTWNVIHFEASAFADGNGSNATYHYTTLLSGNALFRLNQVDKDGKSTYSNIVSASASGAQASIQLYPNPATSILNVNNVSVGAQYRVISISGAVVKSGVVRVLPAQIEVSSLAAGMYIIQFTNANNQLSSAKFIKK